MSHALPPRQDRNLRVGMVAIAIAFAMLGLGYAAVPLYRMFCQATGFGGTTMRSETGLAPGAVIGKLINVRFDANVSPTLPWRFAPEKNIARIAIGARNMAFFTATNLSDHPITGTASFNVTPELAGAYFTKIQCFCFTSQTLKPGETIRMPVVYYVDPAILKDKEAGKFNEITLSYTFFPDKSAVDSDRAGG
ncbi:MULTISPECIES: cytochrome c oxidase assembly protein [unclassified Sphingomonas]|uniref:cytochrome c oxidase assembly protein n=1 Tax=unclassified Sphingomonas TaxID=196159 RepID=UPI0006F6774E|nr:MULTISPECIES: cytochrome c oxidase assembly protein [unclassified Sphingomonas]KQX17774.1 cytochrome C oxidase assembly protein [Sphingomonas sp. Root1294]KQY70700.1 cytochrome C oxidase assembly protein [Sphingomonas sp. Root50]KRB91806.1 cytochrome C oxidase assembly protein [Sphingomonas sp. Root720]